MNYSLEQKPAFSVVGYKRRFSFETSYQEIPAFWDEIYLEKILPMEKRGGPRTEEEKAIRAHCIGQFGLCVEDRGEEDGFSYFIGGPYRGGEVPDIMEVYDFPAMTWAVFPCTGPMPGALQAVNTKIFQEWLPNNPHFEIAFGANLEWYSPEGQPQDARYQSAIWIPVREK